MTHLTDDEIQDLIDYGHRANSVKRYHHLMVCPSCHQRFQSYQTLIQEIGQIQREGPSEGFADRTLSRLAASISLKQAQPPTLARLLERLFPVLSFVIACISATIIIPNLWTAFLPVWKVIHYYGLNWLAENSVFLPIILNLIIFGNLSTILKKLKKNRIQTRNFIF